MRLPLNGLYFLHLLVQNALYLLHLLLHDDLLVSSQLSLLLRLNHLCPELRHLLIQVLLDDLLLFRHLGLEVAYLSLVGHVACQHVPLGYWVEARLRWHVLEAAQRVLSS